jgi:septal ring factor EnvC (AmiA/AmiB activator)
MPGKIPPHLFAALRSRFEKHTEAVLGAVEARSRDRLRNLGSTIEIRQRREIEDMMQLLNDLEENLSSELKKSDEVRQLSLFSDDERTQLRRDRAALEARLLRIPEEREMERLAIQLRHSGLVEHTFP